MRALLTYHSIDPSGSVVSVDEATLQRHVDFLASGGASVLPLHDLLTAPDDVDAVALTFDDGFVNFATAAWPRLSAAGLPATVYVVSDHVGGDNRWGGALEEGVPDLPLMDWETLGRLVGEGLDIGSHTRRHAHLPAVGDEQLHDELDGSRERIEAELGRTPRSLCYPYGAHDERTVTATSGVYEAACTTELRLLDGGCEPHRLPRLDAYYFREPGRLESFGTPRFAAYVARRAMLRNVRRTVRRVLSGGASS